MSAQDVHCATCLHAERWDGDTHTVTNVGGTRRPANHPVLASWAVLLAARSGGPAVVGPCTCGLPMVGAPGQSTPWQLALETGHIEVGDTLVGPGGDLTEAQVTETLERLYRDKLNPGQTVFESAMMGVMMGPIALWLIMLWTTVYFLYNAFMALSGARDM